MYEYTEEAVASRMTAAFAAGALVGAGVAILFAPQSGRQMRQMVADKTHDLREAAGDAIERGQHFVNDIKHKAGEAFEKGREVAHEATHA